jgi:hypothetical protein
MERIKRFFKRILSSHRHIPGKKQYIEFFTALLTIPVLLTVIILNLTSLKNNQKPAEKTTNDSSKEVIINIPSPQTQTVNQSGRQQPTTSEPCNKSLPQASIAQPAEGDAVKENPVAIDIAYKKEGYCAIVWAYRINKGSWSNFDDKSIALYNPPTGNVTLEVRVKSVVTAEEKLLQRNFSYLGQSIDTSPTKAASPSSSL